MSSSYSLSPAGRGSDTTSFPDLYDNLDPNGTSIRLLHVSQDGVYRLSSYDVHHVPKYFAVSYAWIEATDRPNIKCIYLQSSSEAVRIPIQYNLWSFLKHVRLFVAESSFFLWVDRLCINQDNIVERNHQVSMMSKIYRRASIVRQCLRPHGGRARKLHVVRRVVHLQSGLQRLLNA